MRSNVINCISAEICQLRNFKNVAGLKIFISTDVLKHNIDIFLSLISFILFKSNISLNFRASQIGASEEKRPVAV